MNERRTFWTRVSRTLEAIARGDQPPEMTFPERWQLSPGQRASLLAIAHRLPHNGVVIADEVGMGKTRLAAAVIRAVIENKGRVAVVIPPGLGYQWTDELRDAGLHPGDLLRSLGQYFSVWNKANRENNRASAVDATRSPWASGDIVLLSHAFANWRLGESSQAWRWTVLPQVYAQWRRRESNRLPHGFHTDEALGDTTVIAAAGSIVEEADALGPSATRFLDDLMQIEWPATRVASNYSKGGKLRERFERIIGLGLGAFDLVVIDEAHKSRHADTGLAKLIERAMWTKDEPRRLALTATPVELSAEQWKDILHRIKAPTDGIDGAIDAYAKAVREVRLMPSNDAARQAYVDAAQGFQNALKPYLLRRDKREDEAVQRFVRGSQLGHDAYRQESEIVVDPSGPAMSLDWRRAVCAAEALSHCRGDAGDSQTKRLRLTMGSGHGIASLLDASLHKPNEDEEADADADGSDEAGITASHEELNPADQKRRDRQAWWRGIIQRVSQSGAGALYDHPAILAAVAAIESSTDAGEKVLVFGRYTQPLRALVRLLNAREMLRTLDRGEHWPQSKVDAVEWSAAEAAHRQLGATLSFRLEDLNSRLADGYRQIENARERFRRHLVERLGEGLADHRGDLTVERSIFEAFRRASEREDSSDVANLARALHALGVEALDTDDDQRRAAGVFVDLIGALRARNEGDEDGDGQLDEGEASRLWKTLSDRLKSEYSRSEGAHARLLFGGTEPATRRLLQLAFNREHGNPRVLVAQSMVGREGLNLHRACRTVVLLHPEWNPGVVEQQIGRVDRIGSRWQRLCEERAKQADPAPEWPRIEIRPVIFKGTYDEQNWAVLRGRWRDLRAQLHGIVLQEAEVHADLHPIVREINAAAPHFSPTRT